MADILTFRPTPQDKQAIGRILREHPYLNNNKSAAIRAGLAAYHELQIAKYEWDVNRDCRAFAGELAGNYHWMAGGGGAFGAWLRGFTYLPRPDSFAQTLINDRSPVATSQSEDGKPVVNWFVVGDLVIGEGCGSVNDWYVVPLSEREDMPAAFGYERRE